MVSFAGPDGSEPVTLSMSPGPGNTGEASEGSACATPLMSAENSGSFVLVFGQPKAVKRKQIPSVIPDREPVFVSVKQYDAILRLRARRARVRARFRKVRLKNRRPRGSTGRFIGSRGMPQKRSGGSSWVPSSIPAVDVYGPFVATNEDEENTGEDAYGSILNLEGPDYTALLKIMMGDKYNGEISEQFKNVACLQAPDFANLLTVMNNAAYDEATDIGYYDVDRVKLKLSGW